tara:strand:- start:22521 stop:23801 length:1281 start_codon:yes stop_codon:yes gene_type:complete
MTDAKKNIGLKSTFIWTGIQVFIKVLCGLIMNKIVAVTIGPSGLALIGQFQNFYAMCGSIASGSIGSGVVKYTAEYKFQIENRKSLWENSFYIHVVLTFLVLISIVIFSSDISLVFFKSNVSSNVLVFFAATLFFSVLNLLFLSIINGLGDHRVFSILSMCLSVYTMIFVSIGCIFFGITGVINGFIISQSSIAFLTGFVLLKKYRCRFFSFEIKSFNVSKVKDLLIYGVASFVSGMSVSLMLIIVRNIIVKDSSLEIAGYWEAIWKFSVYYTMIGSLPASIYYLPKYSELTSLAEIRKNFWESVRFIIPLMIFVAVVICFFSETFISLMFSKEFLIIAPFVPIIFIGDIIKVFNNLIMNLMYAKKFMNQLILVEIITSLFVVVCSFYLFPIYGLSGIVYSYILAMTIASLYFIFFFYSLNDDMCA